MTLMIYSFESLRKLGEKRHRGNDAFRAADGEKEKPKTKTHRS